MWLYGLHSLIFLQHSHEFLIYYSLLPGIIRSRKDFYGFLGRFGGLMLRQGLYEQLINQELKEEIRSAEAAERQRVETGGCGCC